MSSSISRSKARSRWYFVVAMGRKAGHLALGIAKAAGATLAVIPEEFPGSKTKLDTIADILVGAIVITSVRRWRRLWTGRDPLTLHEAPIVWLADINRENALPGKN